MIARAVHPREPHWERGDNLFPRCVLILGMHETSNADWSDASVTWQLTPLSLWGCFKAKTPSLFTDDQFALTYIRSTLVPHCTSWPRRRRRSARSGGGTPRGGSTLRGHRRQRTSVDSRHCPEPSSSRYRCAPTSSPRQARPGPRPSHLRAHQLPPSFPLSLRRYQTPAIRFIRNRVNYFCLMNSRGEWVSIMRRKRQKKNTKN